jgi:hypothetical protein
MKRYLAVMAVVGGALLGQPSSAQEKYTIQLKEPGLGQSTQHVFKMTVEETIKAGGKGGFKVDKVDEQQKRNYTLDFTATILEVSKASQKPGKVKCLIQRAVYVHDEVKDGDLRPIQGKTVFAELKGDKYEFQVEGGKELEEWEAGILQSRFDPSLTPNFKHLLLPGMPVAVGDSWKLDQKPWIEKLDGSDKDTSTKVTKMKATAKLVKTYKRGTAQFATIEASIQFTVKVVLKAKEKNPESILMHDYDFAVKLDACSDGSLVQGEITVTRKTDSRSMAADGDGTVVSRITTTTTLEDRWQEIANGK